MGGEFIFHSWNYDGSVSLWSELSPFLSCTFFYCTIFGTQCLDPDKFPDPCMSWESEGAYPYTCLDTPLKYHRDDLDAFGISLWYDPISKCCECRVFFCWYLVASHVVSQLSCGCIISEPTRLVLDNQKSSDRCIVQLRMSVWTYSRSYS